MFCWRITPLDGSSLLESHDRPERAGMETRPHARICLEPIRILKWQVGGYCHVHPWAKPFPRSSTPMGKPWAARLLDSGGDHRVTTVSSGRGEDLETQVVDRHVGDHRGVPNSPGYVNDVESATLGEICSLEGCSSDRKHNEHMDPLPTVAASCDGPRGPRHGTTGAAARFDESDPLVPFSISGFTSKAKQLGCGMMLERTMR